MANEEHLEILKKGVEEWNAWREESDLSVADLSDADLSRSNLHDANLSGADLTGANLSEVDLRDADLSDAKLYLAHLNQADLRGADLRFANLGSADLSEADLSEADLRDADLSQANLSGTDLRDANLTNVDLRDANLSKATLRFTTVAYLDLRKVHGLEAIRHKAKSDLASSTIEQSKGQIPEIFLRGCGLQDWEVAAAKLHDPDLTSEQVIDLTYEIARIKAESPIQVNPIFMSYSRTDSDFVDAMEPRLAKKRIRFWRDIHDLVSGRLDRQIERAIRYNPTVLVVLSENSVHSRWVEWEVEKASKLEEEYRRRKKPRDVLCPIALDDSWKHCDWDGPLRKQVEKYNILDFSRWQDDRTMAAAFQKLIDGLGLFYKPSPQA